MQMVMDGRIDMIKMLVKSMVKMTPTKIRDKNDISPKLIVIA